MSGGRGVALMAGVALVLTGFSLVGLGIATASRTLDNATATGTALVVGGVVTVAAGFLFLWFSLKTAALAGLIAVGAASIPVGVGLILASPMIRQIHNADLASERGANLALAGGIAFLMVGAASLLSAWLLSLRPGARAGLASIGRFVGVGYGVLLFLDGLGFALALPFAGPLAEDSESTTLQMAVALASLAFGFLLSGTVLVVQGISAAMDEPTTLSWMPPAPLLLLVFGAILGAGAAASDIAAAIAPLHVLAAAVPAVGLVALAAHGGLGWRTEGARPTWRQVLLAAAFGMAVATAIAGIVEGLAIGGIVIGFLSYHEAFEGLATARQVGDVIGDFELYVSDHEEMATVLLLLSGVAPVVEEAAKGLGVRLLMSPATGRASVFAVGVVVGSGFGVVEALGYGAGAFDDGGEPWWTAMLLRGGATSMHALATGLVALGLYQALARGRAASGVLLYGLAVILHGVWNGLIVLVGTRFLVTWEGLANQDVERGLYALMAAMSVAAFGLLLLLSRRLREPAGAPA